MKVNLEHNIKFVSDDVARALKNARAAGGLSSFYVSQPSDVVDVVGFTRLLREQLMDECPRLANGGGICTVRVGLDSRCDGHLTVSPVPCEILVCAEVMYGWVTCPDEECEFDWECWNYFAPWCEVFLSRAKHVRGSNIVAARIYLVKRSRSVAHTLGGTPYGSQ